MLVTSFLTGMAPGGSVVQARRPARPQAVYKVSLYNICIFIHITEKALNMCFQALCVINVHISANALAFTFLSSMKRAHCIPTNVSFC